MLHGVAMVFLTLLVMTACTDGGQADGEVTEDASGDATEASTGSGTATVRLGLEDIDGAFTEGFTLTFGVDTEGEQRTYDWEQLVLNEQLEWPDGVDAQTLEWWYEGVLVEEVPAGAVTVTGKLHVGMDPPAEPCTRRFDVAAGESIDIRFKMMDPGRGCPEAVEA